MHDARTTGMHWQIGKGGGFHYAVAEARGQQLPATVFLGGPPALILSAIAPLPENVPELMLASLIAGERLPQVHGHGPHPLIATRRVRADGRSAAARAPARRPVRRSLRLLLAAARLPGVRGAAGSRTAPTRSIPATVVGKPRQEDFFIGDLLQELLSPLFPLVMPAVEQLWSYGETGYHSLAAAVVKQRYKREAMASAFRILGEGQLSLTQVPARHRSRTSTCKNFRATLEHILARTHPETDLYVFSNLSMDTLDYTGPAVNEGSKGVWLGLGDPVRELPRQFTAPTLPPGVTDVRVFCGGCLVVGGAVVRSRAATPPRGSRRRPRSRDWPLVVLTDEPARAAAQRHELPVDDVHAVRAGGRHPRRRPPHRPQPHRLSRRRSSSTRG